MYVTHCSKNRGTPFSPKSPISFSNGTPNTVDADGGGSGTVTFISCFKLNLSGYELGEVVKMEADGYVKNI